MILYGKQTYLQGKSEMYYSPSNAG